MSLIKKVLLLIFLAFFLFWFVGGRYLSYDPNDELVGKTISFKQNKQIMVRVEQYKGLLGEKINKNFECAIVSKRLLSSLRREVATQSIYAEERFKIMSVVYLKTYGVFLGSFTSTSKFYILQDNKKKTCISFWDLGGINVKFY